MREASAHCRSCRWAKWVVNEKGITRKRAGTCTFQVEWPPMPWALRCPPQDKIGIWPDSGKNCDCYEKKA